MAIVGAGRVGTALGVLLQRAGYPVVAATGRAASRERVLHHLRTATFVPFEEAAGAAEGAGLVLLTVPDDVVAAACAAVAAGGGFHAGQHVAHVSGSLMLDVLEDAESAGATVLSLHPLQSFPDVETGVARLPGSGIAVTARTEAAARFGESVAEALGGRPFRLADEVKPLYHSAAVFCANYLVTVQATAERLFRLAGIEDPAPLFEPLARTNLDVTFAVGPEEALTGPAARGDVGTIRRNVDALANRAPEALDAYISLARLAADLAVRAGRLSEERRRHLDEELDAWR